MRGTNWIRSGYAARLSRVSLRQAIIDEDPTFEKLKIMRKKWTFTVQTRLPVIHSNVKLLNYLIIDRGSRSLPVHASFLEHRATAAASWKNLKCLHFNVFLDYGKDMELGFICFKVYTDTDSGRHLSITAVLWLPG